MQGKRYETASSIWFVDEDSRTFCRVPRNEDPTHPLLPYSEVGAPETYEDFQVCSDGFGQQYLYFRIGRGPLTSGTLLMTPDSGN